MTDPDHGIPDDFAGRADESGLNEATDSDSKETDAGRSMDGAFQQTNSTLHDPFPNVADPHHHHEHLPPQVHVEFEKSSSSGFLIDVDGPNDDGSLSLVGQKHVGNIELGDKLSVWLPGHNDDRPANAEVVFIHSDHDRYIARLDPATSEAIRQNFSVNPVFHLDARVGEEVGFTQQAGVPFPVFRHGVISGIGDDAGGLRTLNTEGQPGSSGAFACDREGYIVGQVVAYDSKNHVNFMSSAEEILEDLTDFRNGVNLEEKASPVNYSAAVCPAVQQTFGY